MTHRSFILGLSFFILTLLPLWDGEAERRSPYRSRLTSNGLVEFLVNPTKGKLQSPIVLKGHLAGIGRVRFELKKASRFEGRATIVKEDGSEVVDRDAYAARFLRGSFSTREQDGHIAVAVFGNDTRTLSLDFNAYLNRRSHVRLFTLQGELNPDGSIAVRSSGIPASAAEIGGCSQKHSHDHHHGVKLAAAQTSDAFDRNPEDLAAEAADPTLFIDEDLRVADLGLVGDVQFASRFGRDSGAELIATVNAINSIYERDLGVTYNVVSTVIFEKKGKNYPFRSNNASTLLDKLVDYVNENHRSLNADLFHLISGRDIFDTTANGRKLFGVAGIAYVGTTCTQPRLARGVSENAERNLRRVILGHEMGHNFGATHGPGEGTQFFSSTVGIMGPTVTSTNDFFSAFSQSQIESHLVIGSSCLSKLNRDEVNALAESRVLSLRKVGKRSKSQKLRSAFLTLEGQPVVNAQIELVRVGKGSRADKVVKSGLTKLDGSVSFRVSRAGRYFVRNLTPSGDVRSAVIRVKLRS